MSLLQGKMQSLKLLSFSEKHILNYFLHILQLMYFPATLLQRYLQHFFSSAPPRPVKTPKTLGTLPFSDPCNLEALDLTIMHHAETHF